MNEPADIDWSRLRTAHGTAAHVPSALRALADAIDEPAVSEAYWKLDNYVVLQGTLYESAWYVIPFLLAMLSTSRSTAQKAATYDLLIEIARGVPDPHGQWNAPRGVSTDLKGACRQAIQVASKAFEFDLASPDDSIRRRANDLLDSL